MINYEQNKTVEIILALTEAVDVLLESRSPKWRFYIEKCFFLNPLYQKQTFPLENMDHENMKGSKVSGDIFFPEKRE